MRRPTWALWAPFIIIAAVLLAVAPFTTAGLNGASLAGAVLGIVGIAGAAWESEKRDGGDQ